MPGVSYKDIACFFQEANMKTTNNGQTARTVLSIDEMMAAYVSDYSLGETENNKRGRMHGINLKALDLPENATLGEIREAVRTKTIEELNLSTDASDEEIMQAINAKRGYETDKAIESCDYERWKALNSDKALAEAINQENFPTYKELQKNRHIAEEIAEELSLPLGLMQLNYKRNRA